MTYLAPGDFKHIVTPIVIKDPALFMDSLFDAYAHHDAMKGRQAGPLSLAIEAEAVRLVNEKLSDPVRAASALNIMTIACLASGTAVSQLPTVQESYVADNRHRHIRLARFLLSLKRPRIAYLTLDCILRKHRYMLRASFGTNTHMVTGWHFW